MTLNGSSILITGGTGSLGQAIVSRLIKTPAKRVVVYSRDECKQVDMARTMSDPDRVVRYFIGDVRDKERLRRAFHEIDYVIHAAALKHVDKGEYDPGEFVKTNVNGAHNIIEAALDAGVKKVLGVSSDKACLDYFAPVALVDGKNLGINRIVKDQMPLAVKTLTKNGIQEGKIVGWYKNKLDGRKMYKVTYENAFHHRGKCAGAIVTQDHPILTMRGWVRAQDISKDDLLITAELAPNVKQTEMLIGAILGDSHVSRHARPRINFSHSIHQKEWLYLKFHALCNLGSRGIKETPSYGKTSFEFALNNNAAFRILRDSFYPDNFKVIPKDLVASNFTPLMIATWFMDDGCLTGKNARLATHGFSYDDVEWISRRFLEKGMECSVYLAKVDGKAYPELRFTVEGSRALSSLISAYVPDSMKYKILPSSIPYDSGLWDLGRPEQHVARAIVHPFADLPRVDAESLPPENKGKRYCKRGHLLDGDNVRKIPQTGSRQCIKCTQIRNKARKGNGQYFKKDVYCLDIENTHNFIVNGIIVHNCNPVNLYGATKLCADKLFVAGNAYSGKDGTAFAVIRFGNFIGSRGSVLPYFEELIKNGKPCPITDVDMLRYWIPIERAVDSTLQALAMMKGGEIFVPKMDEIALIDFIKCRFPDAQIEVIGRRKGEKLREEIFCDGEKECATESGGLWVIRS